MTRVRKAFHEDQRKALIVLRQAYQLFQQSKVLLDPWLKEGLPKERALCLSILIEYALGREAIELAVAESRYFQAGTLIRQEHDMVHRAERIRCHGVSRRRIPSGQDVDPLGVNELRGRSSGELSDLSKLSNDDLLRSLTHPLLDQRIVDIDLERRLLSSHSVAMIIASVEYHCHFQELSEQKIPGKYPPAKPGALVGEPLKAVRTVANATLRF